MLIVAALAAILAGYALASYRHQRERGYRLGAVAALHRAAQYVESVTPGLPPRTEVVLPAGLAQSPSAGPPVYCLTLRVTGPASYCLEAAPAQEGPMRGDTRCGAFVLDAAGERANRIDGRLTREPVPACW